jgi:hypothetical protein
MDKIIKTLPQNKVNGTLFFIPHMGLGDQIVNNGLINICLEKFNNVILVVKENQLETLKHMYKYTNKIVFYTVQHDREISPKYGFDYHKFMQIVQESGYYFYLQCSHNLFSHGIIQGKCFNKSFYLELGLDPELQYTKFRMDRNHQREMECYNKFIKLHGTDYVIVHQDKSRGFLLDDNRIKNRTQNKNLPWYFIGESENFKLDNLFDFCLIFENSRELHLMPSSISILCDHLDLKGHVYIHYYSRKKEFEMNGQDIKELYRNNNIEILF